MYKYVLPGRVLSVHSQVVWYGHRSLGVPEPAFTWGCRSALWSRHICEDSTRLSRGKFLCQLVDHCPHSHHSHNFQHNSHPNNKYYYENHHHQHRNHRRHRHCRHGHCQHY